MTQLTRNVAAACTALVLVALTWTPLINVPPVQAAALLPIPVIA